MSKGAPGFFAISWSCIRCGEQNEANVIPAGRLQEFSVLVQCNECDGVLTVGMSGGPT